MTASKLLIAASLALAACADANNETAADESALTSSASAGEGCEMFIERIGLASSSHRALTMSVELKVNAALLDGEIEEVGFRGFKGSIHHPSLDPIHDDPTVVKKIGPDTWEYKAIVFHDRADEKDTARTGRFYVKTKTREYVFGKNNFTFDRERFNELAKERGVALHTIGAIESPATEFALELRPTKDSAPAHQSLNPFNCAAD